MNDHPAPERTLILATRGRDAVVARGILHEARLDSHICADVTELICEIRRGAELAIITEEAFRGTDTRELLNWAASQPVWSDFAFVVLTEHGGGLERNPTADRLTRALGNVTFLERPFHPTTLISVVQTNLRGRRRQYECRRLNEELESRVQERTVELATANRQLLRQMEERERVEATLRQMQRLEAVGQLTSGVAHDFNNLLTVVLGNVRFLDRELAAAGIDGKIKRRLDHMRAAAERGAKLTDQMLSFSRRQRLEPRALDLNEAVAGMHELLQSTMGGSIRIETRLARDLWPAMADPTQLELAVLNLAINARDAMQIGGTLTVSTTNVTRGAPRHPEHPPAGDYVEICVADTGSGMPPSVLERVFEPFFTTKEVGKGSGLGLPQVYGFAQQSGGRLKIDSQDQVGTTVTLLLPRSQRLPTAPIDTSSAMPVRGDNNDRQVLLVEDDEEVAALTREMLSNLGFTVVHAASPAAALGALANARNIDIVFSDVMMPGGISGLDLAREIRRRRPGLPIVLTTGYSEATAAMNNREFRLLLKPYSLDALADALSVEPDQP